jgi:hypothetical protein
LKYGSSCTYKLNSGCGYPEFYVNNSNVDIVVTYKKSQLTNLTYEPANNETYTDDEVIYGKDFSGKLGFKLREGEFPSSDSATPCQSARVFVTVTNLQNTSKVL